MPDSVRCSVDPSQGHHTVNCEVELGPEPSASSASTAAPSSAAAPPAPAPAPAPSAPAVTALVNRFVASRHEVHAAPVDHVTGESAQMCLSQLGAVPLLLLGLKAGPLGPLTALKVGYDLGACLGKDEASRQLSADQAAAVKDCESDGGTPTGFVGHSLMCREPGTVTP